MHTVRIDAFPKSDLARIEIALQAILHCACFLGFLLWFLFTFACLVAASPCNAALQVHWCLRVKGCR